VEALAGVSLDVDKGEVHGLLGPNGAGKTTLVKILSTVLLPTSGSATVLGYDVVADVREVRRAVGVAFGGERGLYTRVSARRNLQFWGALYGLSRRDVRRRSDELLERVGLLERADAPVETYSRGMKQRLHLARGLIHDPQVLFLDEPTSGMDPVAAHQFRSIVRELQNEGRAILLTTHDMAEAQALCARVTLIDKGRVLLSDTTRNAARSLHAPASVELTTDDARVLDLLRAELFVDRIEQIPDEVDAWRVTPRDDGDIAAVLSWLVSHGIYSGRRSEPSLEDVYLHFVGDRGLKL
jgi:ABC-2 type transport system ATP-binding protein